MAPKRPSRTALSPASETARVIFWTACYFLDRLLFFGPVQKIVFHFPKRCFTNGFLLFRGQLFPRGEHRSLGVSLHAGGVRVEPSSAQATETNNNYKKQQQPQTTNNNHNNHNHNHRQPETQTPQQPQQQPQPQTTNCKKYNNDDNGDGTNQGTDTNTSTAS